LHSVRCELMVCCACSAFSFQALISPSSIDSKECFFAHCQYFPYSVIRVVYISTMKHMRKNMHCKISLSVTTKCCRFIDKNTLLPVDLV
jgi:hypothetical protein